MKFSRRRFVYSFIIGALSLIAYKLTGYFLRKTVDASPKIPGSTKQPKEQKNISSVISIHSPEATYWDYISYPYVDAIDQPIVEKMLYKGIMELTAEKTPQAAWKNIFRTYQPGDIIAIKPNFNDLYVDFRNNLVTSPAVLNAVIKGLVTSLKISPSHIIVYDCSRKISNAFRERIHYPVHYVEPYGSSFWRKIRYKALGNPLPQADMKYEIKMTHPIKDKNGTPVICYIPKVVSSAQHLINVPILKSHQFILASGALKNHYGTVRFSDGHGSPEYLHPPLINESIADINNHHHIREKTRLIVMDALFGRLKKKGGPPDKWILFNSNDPNRIFISTDPVALDTVTSHLVREELKKRKEDILSHDYLKIASKNGLGVFDSPDNQNRFSMIDYKQFEI